PRCIPAAIAPGLAAVATDAEVNRAAALIEFLGYLAAGSATPDDENRAGRQLIGTRVSACMHLENVRWEPGGKRRHRWPLKGAGRHDHPRCGDHGVVRLQEKLARILAK